MSQDIIQVTKKSESFMLAKKLCYATSSLSVSKHVLFSYLIHAVNKLYICSMLRKLGTFWVSVSLNGSSESQTILSSSALKAAHR
ncbi:hypothetical protein YC2023_021275 [Brassica napus]